MLPIFLGKPMTDSYIIGVDIGTTSVKTALFTANAQIIKQIVIEYPLLSPTPDTQEQNPDQIFAAVMHSISAVIRNSQVNLSHLLGLSLSAAMHSLIAVNQDGYPLTQSITWADRRSAPWVEVIRPHYDEQAIYQRTGTPLHPMSPLVKLLWLRHEYPALFEQSTKFISIKEYILYRWFGDYVVDYSIASATGLLNHQTLDWDEAALTIAGISVDRLSRLVPTTHVLKPIQANYAMQMGIPAGLPVVVGSSDGALANLGTGATEPGTIAVTVGTSGAVRAILHHPQTDPQERLFCYSALTPDQWVVGGSVNSGGIILRWVRDQLADAEVATARLLQRNPYDVLTDIAATVAPGSDGLIFHPYLAGERSPLWDANARGSFFGLTLHHTKAHLVRAVLEGIVYNLYIVLEALQDLIGTGQSIRATGGFARSQLWRQILADVLNSEVIVPESEGSCLGAAILGLYALNQLDRLESPRPISKASCHSPIPQNVEKYQTIIPIYRYLLGAFQSEYNRIAQIQAES